MSGAGRGRRRTIVLPPADPALPARPCIVHLVRAANGPAPLEAFLAAWEAAPPGGGWELVLAMKGFADLEEAQRFAAPAAPLAPQLELFEDTGLDLTVYFAAAARLRRDRYCFLNSYSAPLVPGWLALLDDALMRPGTGLVGASGSWASSLSLRAHLSRLPSRYRGVLPARREARAGLLAIEREVAEAAGVARPSKPAVALLMLRRLANLPGATRSFEPFPAPHLRTNAFMIKHETLARLRLPLVQDKDDAYRLEHGRDNLARQVQHLGLRALVVDRGGMVYEPPEWDRSRTFWQGEQEGLLVADNQTRRYAEGDDKRRALLAAFAWGDRGEPAQSR